MLGTFLSGAASRIFNISLPTVAQSLGTDLAGVSWAYLGYQLSNVGLSLVFGRVGDLYGREKIFAIGFAVFALSSLLCGLSQSIVDLILFRMLQGAGGAMIQSISRALASEAMPEELSGRAQSAMTTAFHTGFLLGPTLGGVINSVPREDRGFASGTLHLMFGIGNVSGIALGSFLMTAAMTLHAGAEAHSTGTEDPAGFVAALNTTFLVATAISGAGLATSIIRGAKMPKAPQHNR